MALPALCFNISGNFYYILQHLLEDELVIQVGFSSISLQVFSFIQSSNGCNYFLLLLKTAVGFCIGFEQTYSYPLDCIAFAFFFCVIH